MRSGRRVRLSGRAGDILRACPRIATRCKRRYRVAQAKIRSQVVKEHILIVDDDRQVTSFLERFFTKNGYRATGVATSTAMFSALANDPADLVVLDLILPDEDGLDAARRLQQNNDVPIIMLSARNEMYDRIVGLELGADDYVTKPHEPRELLARVRSVLRRRAKHGLPPKPAG